VEAGGDLLQMLTPIHHASVSECQEKWLKIIASRPCEREVALESGTADLDLVIDECLQLAEREGCSSSSSNTFLIDMTNIWWLKSLWAFHLPTRELTSML